MKALVFGVDPGAPPEVPEGASSLRANLALTPMALQEMPDPPLLAPDWVVLRTHLTGICGSDTKQVLMDFEGADDNPMTAFISFPQVLGHEVVGTVVDAGPAAEDVPVGQRVVLNPWLSCGPRGVDPPCPACRAGDYSMCESFTIGRLSPGIHTGNATEATGGFAELVPAHRSMVLPVPDDVPDEVAVLGDPFAVSLHAVTRTPPPDGGRALVYGAGSLGTTATAILGALFPGVEVGVVARWPAQAALAEKLGAGVFAPEPAEALVEALAEWSGGVLQRPWGGLPVAYPGGIDVVYDTVGAPQSVEVGLRVLATRGSLVQLGVSAPGRFEWTPWYFKELRLIGSNAFGVEEVEGRRQHGIAHYLDLVRDGRVDLGGMLTHTFPLERWRDAFTTLIDQGETGAIKVAFDLRDLTVVPDIDFLAGRFYVDGAREAYRWLRQHAPVHFDEHSGLWGIARYEDVLAAERDPRTFSSAGGSRPETGPLPWMIDMDGADHSKRRKLVSAGFTPGRVRAAEPHLRDICDDLIDRVCERGSCDFVHDIAAPLPMIVIGDMLGVAAPDRDELLRWSHGMLASLSGEPEGIEAAAEAFDGYVGYAHRMIADRRADPRDDLFSVLVHATVDGDRLEDEEIVFESLLLLIGGDETTRQVSAGGMEQLLRHPEQRRKVGAEEGLLPSAVEEMLRWVSPIKSMARTTTAPVELAGVTIPADAKVLLLYESADFDDRHFAEPERFDVERAPNDHLAFGFGPHFCLGAGLARSELRTLFERVLRRMPDLELATTEPLPRSITGIEQMPVVFSPSPPVGR